MNCSSVRKRPTPAAPDSSRCGMSMSRPAFMWSAIATPSRVTDGSSREQPVLLLPAGAEAHLVGIGGLDVGGRPQMHLAGVAVDDDGVAGLGQRHDVVELPDRGDAERARDDGDVAGRPALLEHQAAQPLAVVVEQLGRPHVAGDDDRVAPADRRRTARAGGPSARAAGGWRDRRNRAAGRAGTGRSAAACGARVSFCTRSTAASAVRPLRIASCSRRVQPRSSANIR